MYYYTRKSYWIRPDYSKVFPANEPFCGLSGDGMSCKYGVRDAEIDAATWNEDLPPPRILPRGVYTRSK